MAKFKDFTKFAASYCPNLPGIVFERAMLSASREYFTRTQAWIEDIQVPIVAGTSRYEALEPYECAVLNTVREVMIGDDHLVPVTKKAPVTREGKLTHYATPNKETIEFYPAPKTNQTAVVTISLKPSINTLEIPDEVFEEHFEGLIAGAIWQVKRMIGTDWYDPQSAAVHYSEFEAFIDKKRIELLTGNNNTELQIEYQYVKG